MFEQEKVKQFYNEYGIKEWHRLERSAYHRLIYLLHIEFLNPYVGENIKVLDVGCGAGRFSIHASQKGSKVTLLDLSDTQLSIAEIKCKEFEVSDNIDGYINACITDMKDIPDNSFDTVICYGAVLNYLHEKTPDSISELIRVTKDGGEILISVNNRNGVFRSCAAQLDFPLCDFWGKPKEWGIYEIINTGNETNYEGATHPSRHFFSVEEIKNLLSLNSLSNVEFAAAPAIVTGHRDNIETLSKDKTAWDTVVYLEKSQYMNESIIDCGEFLLARAKVNKEDY